MLVMQEENTIEASWKAIKKMISHLQVLEELHGQELHHGRWDCNTKKKSMRSLERPIQLI